MVGSVSAGRVVYEVDIDTHRLLDARREIDAALNGLGGSMGRLEASVTRTERSIGSMQRTMSGLSGVAKGLLAALSIQQVAQWGNEWITVSNKLSNAVRANEQLADVTQRVFDISQNTMSDLSSTATLYSRLERSTRSAGTSTADLIKLTSTINKGLAVSGVTAQEASSTMVQLSQALASGVLRGEEFNSISENGSRLAVALADSLGVTIGQLRGMAAQGKLTTDVVVKGLLEQSDVIAKEFSNTVMTMSQAFTVASNNITKFVRENSSANTTISVFNQGLVLLSDNLGVVANMVGVAAAIFGGRFAGALALSVKNRIDDALAARAQAVATAESTAATANAARVTTLKAGLDKEMALSNLAVAKTEYEVAKGTAAQTFALQNLIAMTTIATQTSAVYAEAKIAEAAATRVASTAAAAATLTVGGLARNALSLIGGPVGFAVIAAAGIYLLYDSMQKAKQESIDFADKLDGVIAKMKTMSLTQLAAEIDKANKSIKVQQDVLKEDEASLVSLNKRLEKGRESLKNLTKDNIFYSEAVSNVSSLESESIQLTAKVDAARTKLSQTISGTRILQAQFNGDFRQGIDLLKRDGQEATVLTGIMNQLGNAINFSSRAKDKFNSTSLLVDRPKDIQDYLDGQQDQIELQGIFNDRLRAQKKAEKEIRALAKKAQSTPEDTENYVTMARQRAGAEYDATKALSDRKKADKSAASETKKAANAAESDAQKLQRLKEASEQSAESTEELSRAQAILNAQNSLSKNASAEMIRQAGEYAATKWDTANALKAQAAAEKLLPETKENASHRQDMKDLRTALDGKKITQKEYDRTAERLEEQHQINLAKIRAEGVVSPTAQAKGEIDPVQQLANQHAQELAMIQQFETQKGQITQRGLELMNAANQQYEQQRIAAQWEIWRQQGTGYEVAAAAFDSFAGNASNALTGIVTGSMSVSEAMRSLGSTVLNSVINSFVQMGVEWAKSVIMGQVGMSAASAATIAQGQLIAASMAPAAAMTSLATAGANAVPAQAGIASTVGVAQALSIAGMRKNGGPVTAGSMYQVGEGGKPEIYRSNTGKQYMIPGDNGSVISNKDMQGGGRLNVQVVINNQVSNAEPQYMGATQNEGNYVLEFLISDAEHNGPYISTLQSTLGLSRKANGAF
ncbi:tape measure protein [Superficieibacter sp. HKU1]|uniref:tape measure protein n=1 Tax=Superficieibacter sp. HKU1 TaxID=3031919 RepID=UPI0023E27786|nr:tape measure protein [Superficieibacter sp. HKU1]WES69666.1 tape measure protein [Superficieibacter sp. HKU1]